MVDYTLDIRTIEQQNNSSELKEVLVALINESNTKLIFSGKHGFNFRGKSISVFLQQNLLKRHSTKNPNHTKIEVLQEEPSSQDQFEAIYRSLGVLLPESNYKFKLTPQSHSRVVEVIFCKQPEVRETLDRVAQYTQMNKKMGCKPVVFDEETVCIVRREIRDITLAYYLNEYDLDAGGLFILTYQLLKAYKEQVYNLGLIHSNITDTSIRVNLDNLEVTFTDYCNANELSEWSVELLMSQELPKYYVDPIAKETNHVSTQTDLYSLGMIIAQTAASLTPYHYKPHNIEIQKRIGWVFFRNSSLSPSDQRIMIELLDGLTGKAPLERISLRAALDTFSEITQQKSTYASLLPSFFKSANKCRGQLRSFDCEENHFVDRQQALKAIIRDRSYTL